MGYIIGLSTALTLLWLGMSGIYDKTLILFLGVVSVAASVILAARMNIIDREGSPYHRSIGFLGYLPWLIGEIIKSNIQVIRACMSANLDIEPTLVKVKTSCQSDLAKTVFANSITLTPGTVTVDVDGDMILVHALYESDADPESFDEMDRRASIAMDGKKRKAS